MNRHDALERELTAWFVDTAMPRTPDYATDIVRLAATVRQRPRWAFPERWFPMTVIAFGRRASRPFPWRTVAVLALLALLLVAVAIAVGSRPRLPPPFGPAGNGLVAYAQDGDILTIGPVTGARTWITSGNEDDRDPRWSLDGTRLAFLRSLVAGLNQESSPIDSVVVVDSEGRVLSKSEPIGAIDPDAVAWSPDGRSIAVGAHGVLYIVDAVDGRVSRLQVRYVDLDVYWRPGASRELLFRGATHQGDGLVVAAVDDPTAGRLVAEPPSGVVFRPNGWTPDGRRIVYTRLDEVAQEATVHVLDMATGSEVVIDAGFAHISNDGSRVVAIDPTGKPCIASTDGGPCIAIGEDDQTYEGSTAAAAYWAPNDEWVVVRAADLDGFRGLLLDPTGGTNEQPAWLASDAHSWQRLAR